MKRHFAIGVLYEEVQAPKGVMCWGSSIFLPLLANESRTSTPAGCLCRGLCCWHMSLGWDIKQRTCILLVSKDPVGHLARAWVVNGGVLAGFQLRLLHSTSLRSICSFSRTWCSSLSLRNRWAVLLCVVTQPLCSTMVVRPRYIFKQIWLPIMFQG